MHRSCLPAVEILMDSLASHAISELQCSISNRQCLTFNNTTAKQKKHMKINKFNLAFEQEV